MYITKAGDIICKREVGHIAVMATATATATAAALGVEMQTEMEMRLGALHDHTSEVGIKKAVSQCRLAWQSWQSWQSWQLTIALSYTGAHARSASDYSVNNPARWVLLVFAPDASHGPTSVTRLHSPRFWSAGPTCLL